MALLILTPDITSSVYGQLHVAATLTWHPLIRRRGVHHSRPGRNGENKVRSPCRKAKHEPTVVQLVGCGPAKSCASSVCSSNTKYEALTDVTTNAVFFWNLALKMEAAVLSETLVLSYETIWLHIQEDSIRRRVGRMNSREEDLRLIQDAVQIT